MTFTPALQYAHYGASGPTVERSYATLDTRAGVAHLSRSIQFVAGGDKGWGFTVIQYGHTDPTNP